MRSAGRRRRLALALPALALLAGCVVRESWRPADWLELRHRWRERHDVAMPGQVTYVQVRIGGRWVPVTDEEGAVYLFGDRRALVGRALVRAGSTELRFLPEDCVPLARADGSAIFCATIADGRASAIELDGDGDERRRWSVALPRNDWSVAGLARDGGILLVARAIDCAACQDRECRLARVDAAGFHALGERRGCGDLRVPEATRLEPRFTGLY